MRYWWVNQNQTYAAELGGGYIWSPKRNKNGARNQFYENMRSVAPGDLILSFRDTLIVSVGHASSYCYDASKPEEFGTSGTNWEQAGWKVDVRYGVVPSPIRPKTHIDRVRPLLPPKYSPLQQNGDGLQSVYLAELPEDLGLLLVELLREAGNTLRTDQPFTPESDQRDQAVDKAEDAVQAELESSRDIQETEKAQLIKARRGQGRFREAVQRFETACRLSGVADPQFLTASHIKPWRVASNQERLDGENGLLLSPNVDFLFDRGFISFADDGTLLVSPVADRSCLLRLGVPLEDLVQVGTFSPKQREHLSYHRRNIFLETGRDE